MCFSTGVYSGVDTALQLDAKGVAVQVDFSLGSEEMPDQIRAVAELACQAHREKLPVMFMVAPHTMTEFSELCESIRFCIELGADLIKVRCNAAELENEAAKFRELLIGSPPSFSLVVRVTARYCATCKRPRNPVFLAIALNGTSFKLTIQLRCRRLCARLGKAMVLLNRRSK